MTQINYYLVHAQYRESYGTRWKMKLGESYCILSREELNQNQIEDYLYEQELLWANSFSRMYLISCSNLHRKMVIVEAQEHIKETGEALKLLRWKKGKPL